MANSEGGDDMIQIQTRVGPIEIIPADLEVVFRLNPLALEQLKSTALERRLIELQNGAQKEGVPPQDAVVPISRQQRRQAERAAANAPARTDA